ncbi:MAG: hypothetical protein Q9215_005898 [Flavoplaca cf. flavocitrina]
MSAIPILGPLTPPFAELLQLQTTTPFAFTRHKAKKMQSTGREMRVVEEAAPLQELEPKPMQQNTFSAILEHEKEAKEPKVKDADPRIRNKAKLKPMDLVDPKNKEPRNSLQKAEYAMTVEDFASAAKM